MQQKWMSCVAVAIALAPIAALAQSYPVKPVRLVVGFPPGGGTDLLARTVGGKMTESLGQQVIVDNRPGAAGTVGADHVAKSAPDGYTILFGSVNSNAIAPSIYKKLPYDPVRDFSSIAYLGYAPNVLVVHPSVPVKNVKDLIALAKSRPGQLTSASSGAGTTQHLALEMFKGYTGVNILHVPYKGSGQAVVDLVAGHVLMNFDVVPPIIAHVRDNRLRPIAVTTMNRATQLPDVPTLNESGLKGFEMANWYSVFGPAGLPKDIVTRLNTEVNKALADPAVKKRLTDAGNELGGRSKPEELDAYVRAEVVKYAKVVKDAGIQLD